MIKQILFNTDFSDLSLKTFDVAKTIARKLNAEIHALHIVSLPSHILVSDQGELLDDCEMDNSEPMLNKIKAEERFEKMQASSDVKITSKVLFGHFNETAVKYANQLNPDLIIMGSHGIHSIKERISGSHTEFLAMHVKMPVLNIKEQYANEEINRIVLAGSFQEDDIPNCDVVLGLREAFNAHLCLLRVNTKNNFIPDNEAIEHMKSFAKLHGLENLEYHVFNAHSVEEGIIEFAAKEQIDLLAIGSNQRTGLNKFLQGCVSADLVNHANKPLLTFPLKSKK